MTSAKHAFELQPNEKFQRCMLYAMVDSTIKNCKNLMNYERENSIEISEKKYETKIILTSKSRCDEYKVC
jgi:hypothetical protein